MKMDNQKYEVFFTCLVTHLLFLAFLPLTITLINNSVSQENYSPWKLDWESSVFIMPYQKCPE